MGKGSVVKDFSQHLLMATSAGRRQHKMNGVIGISCFQITFFSVPHQFF